MDYNEITVEKEKLEKYRHLLLMIYKKATVSEIELNALEVVENSLFKTKPINDWLPNSLILEVAVDPFVYAVAKRDIILLEKKFVNDLSNVVDFHLYNVKIKPDLNKINIPSKFEPVKTPWEEVNDYQNKLIDLLKSGTDNIDYRNIGNTARSLLHQLALMVFDSKIHDKGKRDVGGENFKNQLSEYIEHELEGSSEKKIRKLGKSSVDFVCSSVDLMNATTHKLEAKKHLAELCVIGALSTVRIIKIISELNVETERKGDIKLV
ncbi:MAG TPA: hypothetical protein VFM70_11435 [Salinimicrobium sp.]|nr:hypothetical protein [Salinimicrobium sp.]